MVQEKTKTSFKQPLFVGVVTSLLSYWIGWKQHQKLVGENVIELIDGKHKDHWVSCLAKPLKEANP